MTGRPAMSFIQTKTDRETGRSTEEYWNTALIKWQNLLGSPDVSFSELTVPSQEFTERWGKGERNTKEEEEKEEEEEEGKNQKNGIELRGRKHFGWIIHYRGIKKLEWHLSNRERSENKTKKNKEKERDRGEGGNVNTQFRHTGPIPTSLDVQVIESAQCFLSQTGRERGRRRNVKQELCWKNGGLHFGWIIYSIKSRSRVDLIDRNWRYRTR